jgi:hypothetical protein
LKTLTYQDKYVSANLKQFGFKYKLTVFNFPKTKKGFEEYKGKNKGINTEKLDCNISRAKSRIFEYSMCNQFEYFITLTIDGNKYNREDLNKYKSDMNTWLKNYNRNHKIKVEYVLIPELHNDGVSWHMHGLVKGIPKEHLREFTLKEKLPYNIRSEIIKGNHIYNWENYSKRFGYTTVSPIRNIEACSKYITKYISKNLSEDIKELNAHMYYSSNGLKTSKEIATGIMVDENQTYDFQNEYVKIKWYDNENDIKNLNLNKVFNIRKRIELKRYIINKKLVTNNRKINKYCIYNYVNK